MINGLVLMVFILLNVLIGGVILSAVAANAAAAWRSRYDEPTETPAEPAMVR